MAYASNPAVGGLRTLGKLIRLLAWVALFPLGIQAPKNIGILIAKQQPFSLNHLFDHEQICRS